MTGKDSKRTGQNFQDPYPFYQITVSFTKVTVEGDHFVVKKLGILFDKYIYLNIFLWQT